MPLLPLTASHWHGAGFFSVYFGAMAQNIPRTRAGNRTVIVPGFDPQMQPILPLPEILLPLSNAAIQLDFIREAFNSHIDWKVEPVFTESFQADSLDLIGIVHAAVFMPLVQRPDGLHLLLTRRASHLYDHAGQICFPGGRIETTDHDAVAAALRETREEIGVAPEYIQLLGSQPGFLTSTRFTMKPIIGHVLPGFIVRPDLTEVAEVFEVPLSFLMDPAHHFLHRAHLPDGGHRFYFSMPWNEHFIWGATAALIRNFYHFLAAAQAKLEGRAVGP